MDDIEGILFDYDGTIANTMDDNFRCWEKSAVTRGLSIEGFNYFALEGCGPDIIAEKLIHHNKLKYNLSLVNDLVYFKKKYYQEECSIVFYPKIFDFISYLRNTLGLKTAIITGADRNRIQNSIPKEKLNLFDCIITSDDVKFGKPNPEPYLRGCEKLLISPQNSIVIENAPLGILSAKKASCTCFSICTTLDKSHLDCSDKIFKTHKELYKHFNYDI